MHFRQFSTSGSGFIVREDGLIITNAHVVRDTAQIVVQLGDGRSFLGRVMAVDYETDLASIKIEAVRCAL